MDKINGRKKGNYLLYILNLKMFPFFVLFFVLVLLHIPMALNYSDDALIGKILDDTSIFSRMKELFFNVNGKVFTDTAAAIFTHLPWWIFKLLNPLIFVVIAYCISTVFLPLKWYSSWISVFLVLQYPLFLLKSAGFVATSTNYLWPVAAILVILLSIKKHFYKKRLYLWEYFIYCSCIFYVCSQDQSALILVISLLIICLFEHDFKKFTFLHFEFLLSVCCFATLLLCPGHQNRSNVYGPFRIPFFPTLNVIDKLQLGITSTCSHFLVYKNTLFLLFCIFLLLLLLIKKQSVMSIIIGSIPLCVTLFLGYLGDYIYKLFPSLKTFLQYSQSWGWGTPDFKSINSFTFTNWKYYMPLLLTIIVLGAIISSFFSLYGFSVKGGMLFLIFSAGLCSRIIMAFSPTLYGSSFRTFSFMYFCIIICSSILICDVITHLNKREVRLLFITLTILTYINLCEDLIAII